MKLQEYRNATVGRGSALANALQESPAAAKKVYDDTTTRFDALYPGAKQDRIAFENWSKQ